jgi:hypothetical protein
MRPVPNRSFGGGGTMKVARTTYVLDIPAANHRAHHWRHRARLPCFCQCGLYQGLEQWRIHLRGMFNSPEVYRVEGRKASVCFKLNFQLGSYYQRKQSVRNWNHDVSSTNAVRKQVRVRVRVRVQARASTVYKYRFPIMSPSTQVIVRSPLGYSTSMTSVRGAPLGSE